MSKKGNDKKKNKKDTTKPNEHKLVKQMINEKNLILFNNLNFLVDLGLAPNFESIFTLSKEDKMIYLLSSLGHISYQNLLDKKEKACMTAGSRIFEALTSFTYNPDNRVNAILQIQNNLFQLGDCQIEMHGNKFLINNHNTGNWLTLTMLLLDYKYSPLLKSTYVFVIDTYDGQNFKFTFIDEITNEEFEQSIPYDDLNVFLKRLSIVMNKILNGEVNSPSDLLEIPKQ